MNPPPSFPVEPPPDPEGVGGVRDYIHRRVNPIFQRELPSETNSNHTSVGCVESLSQFNLHNFRLYFKYSEPSGGVGRGRVGGRFAGPFFRNYDSEKAFIDSSTGSSVVVKRVLAEVRWAIREWWRIDNARSQEEITSIREAETRKAVAFFRAFVSEVGGSSDFLVVRSYPFDNKLINSLTERQPARLTFETDVVKKLYPLKVLEYKTMEAAIQQAHNAGLYDFSPVVGLSLDLVAEAVEGLVAEVRGINPLARIKERVQSFPGDLLRPDVQALFSGLSDSEKCFLSDWLFERFKV